MSRPKEIAVVENGAVYVLTPGTPVFLKTPDVASMFDVSYQWIGQKVSSGVLHKTKTPHGLMFDNSDTVLSYIKGLQRTAQEKAKTKEDEDRLKFENSIKQAKATIAMMEAKELTGKMHRSEDVAAMTEDLIFTIRGMLLSLPGRLADDTYSADSAAEAEAIIRKEVFEVMEALSRYQYDPRKYEERVRERKNWKASGFGDDDDE